MNRAYEHCPRCGAALADGHWPKRCDACGAMQFLNPTPVAVLLQPVAGGLLTVRRDIEPHRGELALPGGFIDLGESWQEAAARELNEETRLDVEPADVVVFDVVSAPDGTLLVFGEAPPLGEDPTGSFEPLPEVSELVVLDSPRSLAFDLHTKMVTRWFHSRDA